MLFIEKKVVEAALQDLWACVAFKAALDRVFWEALSAPIAPIVLFIGCFTKVSSINAVCVFTLGTVVKNYTMGLICLFLSTASSITTQTAFTIETVLKNKH